MNETALYRKLAEVVAEVGAVAKDGTNTFQNYKYTSAEAMLTALRGPLSARLIVLMPSLTALSEREYQTSKGKASVITTAHVTFTLVDGETGERHECTWAGQGDDPADKGLGKAYTNAIKTFLREQFLIPQGDDPEADPKADERGADRAASKRQEASGRATNGHGPAKVTREDIEAITAAAKGLKTSQIRMALASIGVDASDPFDLRALQQVPKAKAAEFVKTLAGLERVS